MPRHGLELTRILTGRVSVIDEVGGFNGQNHFAVDSRNNVRITPLQESEFRRRSR